MKLNSISVVLNGIIAFQTLKKKESEVFNELNMLKKRMMTDGKRKCWQVFIFNKKRWNYHTIFCSHIYGWKILGNENLLFFKC